MTSLVTSTARQLNFCVNSFACKMKCFLDKMILNDISELVFCCEPYDLISSTIRIIEVGTLCASAYHQSTELYLFWNMFNFLIKVWCQCINVQNCSNLLSFVTHFLLRRAVAATVARLPFFERRIFPFFICQRLQWIWCSQPCEGFLLSQHYCVTLVQVQSVTIKKSHNCSCFKISRCQVREVFLEIFFSFLWHKIVVLPALFGLFNLCFNC